MALLAAASSSVAPRALSVRCSLPTSNGRAAAAQLGALAKALPNLKADMTPQQVAEMSGKAMAGALFAALATSDSAFAAQEVMRLAAEGDNRGLSILLPLVPAVAWVLYNILQPALNQLDKMRSARGLLLGAAGLSAATFAAMSAAGIAEAAEAGAASDNRGTLLLIVLLPAIGWVLYNILRPALNQLDKMRASKGAFVAGALGLGAASGLVMTTPDAQAAAIAEIAAASPDNDSRGTLLLLVLVPAVGWVLFNILRPALNQLDKMRTQK